MVAVPRFALFAFIGILFAVFAQADILVGTKRDDVLAELGRPTSTARRGPREILQYPKNVRIELEGGVVVDIKGYIPEGAKPTPSAPAPSAAPVSAPALEKPAAVPKPIPVPAKPPVATKPAPGKTEPVKADPGKTPAMPSEDDEGDYSPAGAANALGDQVAKMDSAWGPTPQMAHVPESNWVSVVVKTVLHFGSTLLALMLAFKFWEMDAFWRGKIAIAAIDAIQHAALEALGPFTHGLTTMMAVQYSVPALAMIFTVRHFCFNKGLQNAALTAGFVKSLVIPFDIFFPVLLLQAIAG